MTILTVFLLLIGLIFLIGSFFVAEKLSPSEVQKMAELSDAEIKKILEKRLEAADSRITNSIDDAIDGSIAKVERSLDKETNEKIMAIHEYSDTVMDEMSKTRDEITFLYSMLNDRHSEMTEMAGDLKELIDEADSAKKTKSALETYSLNLPEETAAAEPEAEPVEPILSAAEFYGEKSEEAENTESNHNRRILELADEGKSAVEIAKELSLGVGEVQLVLELGKRNQGVAP